LSSQAQLKENAFQKAVVEMAHRFQWRAAHFPTSMGKDGVYRTALAADAKGWPDLCLVRERAVWVECKTQKGTLRLEQAAWLSALMDAGQECYITRPDDSDALEAVLRAREGRGAVGVVFRTGFDLMTATRLEVARVLAKVA
jgi:hypothetical protein